MFESVTREELEKSIKSGDKERERQMRALMLVLPYHSENMSSKDLEEVYTKSPVTKIINDSKKKPVQSHIVKSPEGIQLVPNKATTFRPLNIPGADKLQSDVNPSTYHPKSNAPKKYVTKSTQKPLTNEDVHDILSSLGIANQLNLVTDMSARTTTRAPRTTTTTEVPDTTTEFSPEFQKLLQAYGLLNENGDSINLKPLPTLDAEAAPLISSLLQNNKPTINVQESSARNLSKKRPVIVKPSTTTTPNPEKTSITSLLKPLDYTGFKPLTIDEDGMDQDMEEFLKQFGLIDSSGNRDKKSMKIQHEKTNDKPAEMFSMPDVNPDIFSEDQMKMLGNMGIPMKDQKKSRKIDQKSATNIFKPAPGQKSKSDQEDYRKLEQLLETIKELDRLNANLTEDELDRLDLKRFNLSDALLAQGPSPLEFTRNTYQFPSKNEIKKKRQNADDERLTLDLLEDENDKNNSSSSLEIISTTDDKKDNIIEALNLEKETTETSSATEAVSTTTEEARNLLEDELEPNTEEEEPLPLPRRNGFYFLADWNSFLEVGQDEEKIIVRFNPKIGDPTRFIPVTVP